MTAQDLCELGEACKSTRSMLIKKDIDRSMKFLMGLNEAFFQIRSQILSMEPLPSLERIYSTVLQHQIQTGIGRNSAPETAALFSNSNHSNTNPAPHSQGGTYVPTKQGNKTYGNYKGKKPISCTYCQALGHSRESYYKLNGYPPGYKTNKSGQQGNRVVVNNIVTDNSVTGKEITTSAENYMDFGSIKFNQEQLNKLMALLGDCGNDQLHMAGISCLASIITNEFD